MEFISNDPISEGETKDENTNSGQSMVEETKNEEVTNRQFDTDEVSLDIEQLPPFLQPLIGEYEGRDQKMMLMSILTVVSSVLPKVYGNYNHYKVFANFYLYIIGKAGSGKGEVNRTRKLLTKIQKGTAPTNEKHPIVGQLLRQEENFNPLPGHQIILPANSSTSGFTKLFSERKGNGLIFETEGDTLANILKTDYGNYSDLLRKAFHHEAISQYRKTDDEYLDIENPKLSVLITSTENQLKRIVTSAENGLFSRFIYWYTQPNDQFIDVFGGIGDNRAKLFETGAEQLFNLYHKLNDIESVRFDYTDDQKKRFVKSFRKVKAQLTNLLHADLEASSNRLAIMMFRLSMVLTVLRNIDNDLPEVLYCSDQDYKTVEALITEIAENAFKTLESLPNQVGDKSSDHKMSLFLALPDEFSTSEAKKEAKQWNLGERTVDRFLKSNCFEKVAHGRYKKAK